jgi:hypothetical protein
MRRIDWIIFEMRTLISSVSPKIRMATLVGHDQLAIKHDIHARHPWAN